jgi:hypothetical protein
MVAMMMRMARRFGGGHLPRITVVERGSKSSTLERSDTLRQLGHFACS